MSRDYATVLNGRLADEQVSRRTSGLSVIFGAGVQISENNSRQRGRRIAVYPCLCDVDLVEPAQGLMVVLAWLLNSVEGVTALPILTRNVTQSSWSSKDSLFGPGEFQLDGLGEDTIVTAVLSLSAGANTFKLTATTELEETEDLVITISSSSIGEIAGTLLRKFADIVEWLEGESPEELRVKFAGSAADDVLIAEWLTSIFGWHRVCLQRAGAAEPFKIDLSFIRNLNSSLETFPATWLLIQGIYLVSNWFEAVDARELAESCKSLGNWQEAASALARVLVERGETRPAVELLELAVEGSPGIAENWLVLARLYEATQRSDLAIEVLQRGIESNEADPGLPLHYGDLLMSLAEQGNNLLSSTILLEDNEEPTFWSEAVAAFEHVIQLTGGTLRLLGYLKLITALSELNASELWPRLEELATFDEAGSYVELVLNIVSARDDLSSSIAGLERATQMFSKSATVWRNLAYALYLCRDNVAASIPIRRALDLTTSDKTRGEYELLAVCIEVGEAEGELADIADRISAGNQPFERDLEFLEWIVSKAPHYSEGYLLLAKAYAVEGEGDTALEVLLDAEKIIGSDAEFLTAIVDQLREAGEFGVALDYVSKGLDLYPSDVSMLARGAQVAFELGDLDGAQSFIRRAHSISPYDRELLRVTKELSERGWDNA